jgi:hypothetical protein
VQNENNTNRLLNVVNSSDLPTSFQFVSDRHNTFSFSQTEGIVKAHSSVRVIITFNPTRTGNFYERVFCLVRNHKVLYVDLMGTCYDILTKPIPLSQRHVDTYRHKVIMGAHKKASAKDFEGGEDSIMDSAIDVDYLEKPIDDPCQAVLHKEMLLNSAAATRDIRFSADSIDFAFTESGRLSEARQLVLENKFGFPVKVDWTLMDVFDGTANKLVSNPFKVSPECQEIPANSTFVFNVEFAPYESSSYFFQLAQCFVYLINGNSFKTKKLQSQAAATATAAMTT